MNSVYIVCYLHYDVYPLFVIPLYLYTNTINTILYTRILHMFLIIYTIVNTLYIYYAYTCSNPALRLRGRTYS